jgi:quercetin dioxygenase-like cupin family protein
MKAIAAAVVLALLYPATALSQTPSAPAPESRVLVQPPGAGFKAISKDTNGAYSLAENRRDPGGGVEPHTHSIEDESFYVIEGQFAFQIGDRRIEAPAGTFVFGPRGVRHSYKNEGTTPGRLLVLSSPAGFEKFLAERQALEKQLNRSDPAYAERWKALQQKYGMQY